jgi:hypothetical protein
MIAEYQIAGGFAGLRFLETGVVEFLFADFD